MQDSDENVEKAFGLPEGIDPDHRYVYRSGEHGIFDFWYVDNFGNYWKYTNAPKDHPDYEPYSGDAFIVDDQPMPHTTPQFYSTEGRKLHMAVPQGMQPTLNEAYDPLNPRSVWYAMYRSADGEPRYVYYDSDIRENLDLWVQYMLRVTDAGVVYLRKYAVQLFESPNLKDRVIGTMLMLADQGCFEAWELTQATVGDVEYTDYTLKLLGRKIVCDHALVDFFTALTAGRESTDPLFILNTVHGQNKVGFRHFYSIFKALKISPHFLLYWNATQLFSRIMHRLAFNDVPVEDVEELALAELGRALNLGEDPLFLVDVKTKETLLQNYTPLDPAEALQPAGMDEQEADEDSEQAEDQDQPEGEDVQKALIRVSGDDLGVATVWSDLDMLRPEERQFSNWLHVTPLHDTSPEEMQQDEMQLDLEQTSGTPDMPEEADVSDEGAVRQGDDQPPVENEGEEESP